MHDITEWFRQSCSELEPQEMVKPSSLTMLDAMNALQLMDPKMDTGMTIWPMNAKLFEPDAPLSPEEICAIMDQMLCLELAWYRGASLCQTVYQSLYYHNPHHLAGPCRLPESQSLLLTLVLRAYVLLGCKTVDLAYSEFAKNHVSDGEDCWLDHYGVPVRMSDSVDDVDQLANDALNWLEGDTNEVPLEWREQLVKRIVFRRSFMRYLDCVPRLSARSMSNVRIMRLASENIKNTGPSSERVQSVFDPNIASALRHNMPLAEVEIPTSAETWESMRYFANDLLSIEVLLQEGTWSEWESRYTMASDQVVNGTAGYDRAVQDLLSSETGHVHPIFTDFTASTASLSPGNVQQLTMWKSILTGYLFSTTSASLLNRSRQRRAYATLSTSWRERAIMSEQLSRFIDLTSITKVLEAVRFDCLLEASLAALDLELITNYEESESWWWMHQVTSTRLRICQSETWRSLWAQAWACISYAMLMLLAIRPLNVKGLKPSKARFNLRYKHALKTLYLPDGRRATNSLIASFESWQKDWAELRTRSKEALCRGSALRLVEASDLLDRLSASQPKTDSPYGSWVRAKKAGAGGSL
ncbi:hypothetical protein I316_06533 [Kwoniella heveanensis BCC8398]|uniref:NAA35-like N-terminal domain-containing protein n=1 Tax=Kwoniella heveanensis BCC8398 TaxID=1296120 RepID=A0A1B9GL14_9TREE|nr:hypothetical protein I316_06533 [Kwoniella heveanensis BCC8398]